MRRSVLVVFLVAAALIALGPTACSSPVEPQQLRFSADSLRPQVEPQPVRRAVRA